MCEVVRSPTSMAVGRLALTWICLAGYTSASSHAERLYSDLMQEHNKLVRPVFHNTGILNVSLGLRFLQLIGVDEVNQVITTRMMVRQSWNDYKLQWWPDDYGGITHIDVPADSIWLPDIVLYNNADGNYQITSLYTARINWTGHVVWEPACIYKSSCMVSRALQTAPEPARAGGAVRACSRAVVPAAVSIFAIAV
ncbi:putative Acetylcholine receptor subunit alpha-like 1 [Hypsibius exemplaris]|uniref:Acetylcholine receptor subunit alpha-like 1 n=1 Tax=Hypsibius exemplaris TaxID=2072580 RepID=A0A1W0WJC8_HYPEX|nr:putative Acetylcholine receptor subunit alpha-like 1 [Hypsibius exemplaris]